MEKKIVKLESFQFNNIQKKYFKEFFQNVKVNEIISPYKIIQDGIFTLEETKKIFNLFTKEGYFKTVFIVKCPECYAYSDIFESIENIYTDYMCKKCEFQFEDDTEFFKLRHYIQVLYKVVEE